MPEILKKTSTKLYDSYKNMQKGQKARIFILLTFFVIAVVAIPTILNQKSYSVLYSGMDAKEAGEVLSVLADKKIDAKAQGSDTILVASDQVDAVRMELAAEGYPTSGFNFDIFKNAAGLGTTDMEKQVYLQFQLQENLRQTIKKMDKIDDAVVNINLAEQSSFVLSENTKPATAAVMLTLNKGKTIGNDEVRAIAELVAKSVSGLKLENVRIVDSKMNLYSIDGEQSESKNVGTQLSLQQNVQQRLQQQVINLLSPVFGTGKVLAEVNVTLNFDTKTTQSVVFTPPIEGQTSGIAVSMNELAETIKNAQSGGVAGIDSNGAAVQYPSATNGDTVYSKVSKETNFELNETKTQIENAKGKIEDLSVAIILDASNNAVQYTDNVKKLVANAIGVNADRISVETLPFLKTEETDSAAITEVFAAQQQLLKDLEKAEMIRYIIVAAAGLFALILLLFIIKSFRPKHVREAKISKNKIKGNNPDTVQKPGSIEAIADELVMPKSASQDINFDNKDTNLSNLEKYIDKSPESVAQLLRNWLAE